MRNLGLSGGLCLYYISLTHFLNPISLFFCSSLLRTSEACHVMLRWRECAEKLLFILHTGDRDGDEPNWQIRDMYRISVRDLSVVFLTEESSVPSELCAALGT